MREHRVSFPELAVLAVTRGMIGFGLGLLVSPQFTHADRRRVVGTTLLVVGALSTIPIAIELFRKRPPSEVANGVSPSRGKPAFTH